jgi:myo-inositol-1(or 4)-monophosphatase
MEPKPAPAPVAAVKSAPAPLPASVPTPAAMKPHVAVPAQKSKVKVLPREFLVEIANAIRSAVLPFAREGRGREIVGTATSGDPTFELDRIAEKALLTFLKNARLPVAYYSENAGYTTFTNTQPQNLLIVDPIDGTRAAKSGFEGCVIAIASTRVIERPCMADIDNACVMELIGTRTFYAERGKGLRITQGNHVKRVKPVKDLPLELIAWSMTVPARPAELIFPTAGKLIDLTALKGGFFACNSTSFSLTRLVTNQLDACIDIANRFYRDVPYLVRDHFINAGRGTVLGIAPYDLAAGLLVAEEAGCTVTDAFGKKFDDVLLLDTSVENQRSLIATSDSALHTKLLNFFDTRIRQFEEVLRRRAERAAMVKAAHSGRAQAKA